MINLFFYLKRIYVFSHFLPSLRSSFFRSLLIPLLQQISDLLFLCRILYFIYDFGTKSIFEFEIEFCFCCQILKHFKVAFSSSQMPKGSFVVVCCLQIDLTLHQILQLLQVIVESNSAQQLGHPVVIGHNRRPCLD